MALRGHCSPQCPLPPLPPSSSQSLFPTTALHVCARAPSNALWPAFSPTRLVSLRPHQLPCPCRLAVAPTLPIRPPGGAPFLRLLCIPVRPTTRTFRAPRASASDPRGGVPAEWAEGLAAAGTTLYDVLGLARRDASMHDIKVAYRREARRYHPDSRAAGLSEAESTRRFIAVQRAYDVLSNPQQRARYDWELLHPLVAGARHGALGMRTATRWRHGKRRPWMGQAMWDGVESSVRWCAQHAHHPHCFPLHRFALPARSPACLHHSCPMLTACITVPSTAPRSIGAATPIPMRRIPCPPQQLEVKAACGSSGTHSWQGSDTPAPQRWQARSEGGESWVQQGGESSRWRAWQCQRGVCQQLMLLAA
ncbi:unnamed protein product [Closterium sp. NIES-64]|nr:unnamed protein product [Closterium sp. NIES-64]